MTDRKHRDLAAGRLSRMRSAAFPVLRLATGATLVIGIAAWATVLAWHHSTDVDLWSRLAAGAKVWHTGSVWQRDVFAFTPVLPEWIDHEWGAGLLFYAVLWLGGPLGLMMLKLMLGSLALWIPLRIAHRTGAAGPVVLLLAPLAAWTILLGYVPVIRSHAFTYVAFGLVLSLLQAAWTGRTRWLWPIPLIIIVWTNIHGGFVTGFAAMACYTAVAIARRAEPMGASRAKAFAAVIGISVAATLVNPYGLRFWAYLAPALAHPRTNVVEWRSVRFLAWDGFTGFRLLCIVAIGLLAYGVRRLDASRRRTLLPGLLLMVATAAVAWMHRRHIPFFGITAAAFLPILLDPLLRRRAVGNASRLTKRSSHDLLRPRTILVCLALYLILAGLVSAFILPEASLRVISPMGKYPVRECDILIQAEATGNAVVPFSWGSYVGWRLYPRVKVSMDGRYEETYPESTFDLNYSFYARKDANWSTLVRDHPVDYVFLDLRRGRGRVRPADVEALGYVPAWTSRVSGIWCRPELAERLRGAAASLPAWTIEPLDAAMPNNWPWPEAGEDRESDR